MRTLQARSILSLRLWLVLLVAGVAVLGLRPRPSLADNGVTIVVSIGDSVASGEGAPDVPKASGGPRWLGWSSTDPYYSKPDTCHRSNQAGPALAFYNRIRPAYPSSAFLHVACSGAGIFNGLTGQQLNDDGSTKVGSAQIIQVQKWMRDNYPGKRIDALFVSAGANDINFDGIAQHCIVAISCENDAQWVKDNLTNPLAALASRYDALAWSIVTNLDPVKVFITEYPEVTRKTWTEFCNSEPLGDPLMGISGDEAQWASQYVVGALNAKIRQAAERHAAWGWQAVGVADWFVGYGYCSSPHGINTYGDSQYVQGDEKGTLHPNYDGHRRYAGRIGDAFLNAFPPGAPAAPSGLWDYVTYSGEIEHHTLKWRDNSTSETQFVLKYQVVGTTSWTSVTLGANTTQYGLGTAFKVGQSYTFYAQACNAAGCSPASNWITVDL